MTAKNIVHISSELRELIPEYMQNIYDTLDILKKLLVERNWEEIRREGHKMKGHGLAYGFARISEIGIELEKAAKAQLIEEIPKLIQSLEDYVANLEIQYKD